MTGHTPQAEPLRGDPLFRSGRDVLTRWSHRIGRLAAPFMNRVGRRLHGELVALADDVRQIAEHSERPYLDLGRALQRIHGHARALQEAATDSAQQHSDEVLGSWLPRLQALVHSLERQLQSADDQLGFIDGAIRKVGANFLESRASLRELSGNVLTLRMLATLARIESAHLAAGAGSIRLLAEEVGKQADDIGQRTQEFLEQSERLIGGLREVHERIEQLDRSQSVAGPVALRHVAGVLTALAEHRDRTRERLEQTAQLSRNVAWHTGEVVASLQFHDITRQRLEHVSSALRQSTGARATAPAPLLRLLSGQVDQASQDLWQASERMTASLHAIAGATRALADQLAGPEGLGNGRGAPSTRATPLEQQLEQAIPALQAAQQGAGRVAKEVRALSQHLAGYFSLHLTLTTLAAEVEAITEVVKRVGLNASIKAATFGSQGAPLAALAQAIQGFSTSVASQSGNIRRLLSTMDDVAGRMRGLAAQEGAGAAGEGGARSEELLELLHGVHGRFARLTHEQERLQADSRTLAAEIAETAGSFRAHHTLADVMERIRDRMLRLADQRHPRADTALAAADPALHGLAGTYTMARERETHQRLMTPGPAPTPLPGALAPAPGGPTALPKPAEDSLGDNVELF